MEQPKFQFSFEANLQVEMFHRFFEKTRLIGIICLFSLTYKITKNKNILQETISD